MITATVGRPLTSISSFLVSWILPLQSCSGDFRDTGGIREGNEVYGDIYLKGYDNR